MEDARNKIDRQIVIKSWLKSFQNPQKFEDFEADQSRGPGLLVKHEERQTKNKTERKRRTERQSCRQTVHLTDRQTRMQ